ncbi:Transcriptional regulator, MerR family [Rhodovulum sp. P5]|nr:Transcriptional regulator, MerR family [Rhodovulum sp. P5]
MLRFWESKFSQIKPVKRAGGRRYYRPADMLLLGGIKKLLHEDGLTIRGVQKILREQGVKAVAALSPAVEEGFVIDMLDDEADTPPLVPDTGESGPDIATFHHEDTLPTPEPPAPQSFDADEAAPDLGSRPSEPAQPEAVDPDADERRDELPPVDYLETARENQDEAGPDDIVTGLGGGHPETSTTRAEQAAEPAATAPPVEEPPEPAPAPESPTAAAEPSEEPEAEEEQYNLLLEETEPEDAALPDQVAVEQDEEPAEAEMAGSATPTLDAEDDGAEAPGRADELQSALVAETDMPDAEAEDDEAAAPAPDESGTGMFFHRTEGAEGDTPSEAAAAEPEEAIPPQEPATDGRPEPEPEPSEEPEPATEPEPLGADIPIEDPADDDPAFVPDAPPLRSLVARPALGTALSADPERAQAVMAQLQALAARMETGAGSKAE